jgi:hypothetical protein
MGFDSLGRKIELSIQANRFAYCRPRVDDNRSLSDYEAVEIAIFADGEWIVPSCIPGLGVGFDRLFEPWEEGHTPVAGYVSQLDREMLELALDEVLTQRLPTG